MRRPLTINALLFDLGGVVIDIDFDRVFLSWAVASGVPQETIAARFSFDLAYLAHERGEIEASAYFDSLRNSLGINISDEQFAAGWNAVFVGEMPNIRSVIEQAAKTCPLYLFSNTNQIHKQYWSEKYCETLRPFRELFASSELKQRKPSTEAFHAVARRIGVAPSQIAFFDDLAENVEGARVAGLNAFHVRSASETASILRDRLGIDCAI